MTSEQLFTKAKEHNIAKDFLDDKENLRLDFLKRFPKEKLVNLKLEDYVVGNDNKNTFCYLLEFTNVGFGIGGGSSFKFGIYYSKEYNSYRNKDKNLSVTEANSYFSSLVNSLITMFNLIESNKVEEIDEKSVNITSIVLQLILNIYFPESFCSVGSSKIINVCGKDLNISNESTVKLNHLITLAFNENKITEHWLGAKIGKFIWDIYFEKVNRNYFIVGSMYGGNDYRYPEMVDKSVVSVGFLRETNLNNLIGNNEKKNSEYLKSINAESNAFLALKRFFTIKEGDWIAIKRSGSPKKMQGFLSIVGIAEVVKKDGSIYHHSPESLGQCLNVKYLHPSIFEEFPLGGYGATVHKLKKDANIDLIFFKSDYTPKDLIAPPNPPTDIPGKASIERRKEINIPLNIILYGPPGTGKTYKLLNEYKKYFESDNNKRYEFVTFHQSYTYEDFIEGIKPILNDHEDGEVKYTIEPGVFKRIAQRAANDINNNYAIFIDEINRGNIAGIFGELITLIEQDKREGNENEISTILPYSKEPFSVPSNLYIIGTMNTADRSIEALDTALRRRFSFIEVSPNPNLFSNKDFSDEELDFKKLLIAINQRIEILLDRDHTIGHSYFLSVKKETRLKDLQDIFKDKIIPLLEEYFYGDRGKIKMILGGNFVFEEPVSKVYMFPLDRGDGDIRLEDTSTYNITIPDTIDKFREIYETTSN